MMERKQMHTLFTSDTANKKIKSFATAHWDAQKYARPLFRRYIPPNFTPASRLHAASNLSIES